MTDKIDRRVQKTHSALAEALLALLRTYDWDDVNVRMICDEANIARSSFYLHYDNKSALLDEVFAQGMQSARSFVVENAERTDNDKEKFATITWLVNHVYESHDFFNKGQSSTDVIFRRFQSSVEELLALELKIYQIQTPHETVLFAVGGVFAVLRNWTMNKCSTSVEKTHLDLNLLVSKLLRL